MNLWDTVRLENGIFGVLIGMFGEDILIAPMNIDQNLWIDQREHVVDVFSPLLAAMPLSEPNLGVDSEIWDDEIAERFDEIKESEADGIPDFGIALEDL